jgi:hypothetical protein
MRMRSIVVNEIRCDRQWSSKMVRMMSGIK